MNVIKEKILINYEKKIFFYVLVALILLRSENETNIKYFIWKNIKDLIAASGLMEELLIIQARSDKTISFNLDLGKELVKNYLIELFKLNKMELKFSERLKETNLFELYEDDEFRVEIGKVLVSWAIDLKLL